MKKLFLLSFLCICTLASFAQKETFDLASYSPPAGWSRGATETITSFTIINKKNNSWCRINIVKSTVSKGNIEQDFESEWQNLIVKNYNPAETPQLSEIQDADGWKIKTGVAKFTFSNKDASAMLTTMSGFERCISFVVTTNTQDYIKDIEAFLASVTLIKPEVVPQQTYEPPAILPSEIQKDPAKQKVTQPTPSVTNSGFTFSTTNFDDGWTSTVQEDWVEVTKGTMKVLLHYPKDGTIFPADPEPLTNAAWNILVAPRYKNLTNYKTAYISTYNRPYLGMGYATENATGKNVFIVFFRQDQVWIEFISPDKNTFIQQYKFDPETIQWDSNSDLMIPLANMTVYNKFAIATSDFKGKWTSDFTGIQQLYNVYTGQYAGMNMNQSNEEFIFKDAGTYSWKLLVVNGMAGNAKFTEVKSSGKLTVPNNWQVHFSMIETRARTYHAFWSCIKGARILNLLDADYPGSGIYTKYGLAK